MYVGNLEGASGSLLLKTICVVAVLYDRCLEYFVYRVEAFRCCWCLIVESR
jgi:hypothetical protein